MKTEKIDESEPVRRCESISADFGHLLLYIVPLVPLTIPLATHTLNYPHPCCYYLQRETSSSSPDRGGVELERQY